MRLHRSLTPEAFIQKGPSRMALMIASEFWRAKEGAEFHDDVRSCYERARELMGVFETVVMSADVCADLRSFFWECRATELFRDENFVNDHVTRFSERLATAFERAARNLSKESHA